MLLLDPSLSSFHIGECILLVVSEQKTWASFTHEDLFSFRNLEESWEFHENPEYLQIGISGQNQNVRMSRDSSESRKIHENSQLN